MNALKPPIPLIRGNTLTSLHFTSSSKLAFLITFVAGVPKCQRINTSAPRVGINLSGFSLFLTIQLNIAQIAMQRLRRFIRLWELYLKVLVSIRQTQHQNRQEKQINYLPWCGGTSRLISASRLARSKASSGSISSDVTSGQRLLICKL